MPFLTSRFYSSLLIMMGCCLLVGHGTCYQQAQAADITKASIAVGAHSKRGGSNGANLLFSTVQMVFDDQYELMISLVPGVYGGWYIFQDRWYASTGPGVHIGFEMAEQNSLAEILNLGWSGALGYELFCYFLCFGVDYRQFLIFNHRALDIMAPYNLHLTLSKSF